MVKGMSICLARSSSVIIFELVAMWQAKLTSQRTQNPKVPTHFAESEGCEGKRDPNKGCYQMKSHCNPSVRLEGIAGDQFAHIAVCRTTPAAALLTKELGLSGDCEGMCGVEIHEEKHLVHPTAHWTIYVCICIGWLKIRISFICTTEGSENWSLLLSSWQQTAEDLGVFLGII